MSIPTRTEVGGRLANAPAASELPVLQKRGRVATECAAPQGHRSTRTTPNLWIGGLLTAILLLAAALGPSIAPYPPDEVMAGPRLDAPSPAHPFGTDSLGRDMLSRLLHGARIALGMAAIGVGIAATLGILAGLIAGYYAGWTDWLLARLMDMWLAFPGMLLALVIVARLGPSLNNAILALGIAGVPGFFRLTRCLALSTRCALYVEAARSVGASDSRVLSRHILPNLSSSLLVLATSRAGMLLLAGGALSFLGLGAQPPAPEWGALLAQGRSYMDSAPWLAIYPGICITLAVVGLNLFGDGLRDYFS